MSSVRGRSRAGWSYGRGRGCRRAVPGDLPPPGGGALRGVRQPGRRGGCRAGGVRPGVAQPAEVPQARQPRGLAPHRGAQPPPQRMAPPRRRTTPP